MPAAGQRKAPSNPRRDVDMAWLARLRKPETPLPEEPPITEEFRRAIRQFNHGDFFGCHETLELLWLHQEYPQRLFYQGILKVAVGLHHFQKGNTIGALAKLREGRELLEPFAPRFMGLDVAKLQADLDPWIQELEEELPTGPLRRPLPTIAG